ncbi:TPA: PTS sugar transporter subunit IIC, partial [Enterococcus faecalis]|nr:PTS sugar transporter subunit IIC [Enterococcus faecalis]
MGVLGVSIIMGLYYWFARLRFGYTFSGMLSQPLGAALVAGLATGKLSEAMVVGAGIQLVYLGVTSTPGGNVPSDPALASAIAIPIALGVGMNAEAAVALAVPFGVLGVFMDQLRRTINATWVHMADKYAEELNYGGIYRAAFVYPALAGFLIRFPLVFAANFFGQSVVNKVLEVIPAWLMHGFEVMGGILPALG